MGFGNSDLTGVTSLWDTIRWLFSVLDRPVYGLLSLVYQLFFNVASSEILSGKMVAKFYGRIQLIIGVFMMFQLAMVIIKGIMNPDSFTDKKTGAGNVITRIMVSLFMLTLIVPINIPNASNEYERKISSNGLLFGTLYSLQYRILNNNTIGKLVLGVKGDNRNYAKTGNMDDLERSANRFTSTILRVFYRVNTVPKSVIDNDSDYAECRNLDDPAAKSKCRVCDDTDSGKLIKTYAEDAADPQDILHMVNESCNGSFMNSVGKVINLIPFVKVDNKERYVFVFTPLLSTVVGIAMIFIFLSFTIDVAVRAIKIAVLRLIAPIPIISYMDPNGSKDSAFNAWVKTLSTTYLSLFLRLAIVYFVLFVIEGLMENGITMNKSTGMLGGFTTICIFIGLFVFAKQAPKFIKEALGIKDSGGKFFSGISEAMGVGAVAAGVVSGTVSRVASTDGNVGKKALFGLVGGVGGGYNAGKTLFKQKDVDPHAIMNANRAYATKTYSNAADKSTFGGRLLAGAQANLGLKNELQTMDDKIKYFSAADAALGRINKAFDNNGDYKVRADNAFMAALRATGTAKGYNYSFNTAGDLVDNTGNVVLKKDQDYSLKEFNDRIARFSSSSDGVMKDALDEAKKQAQGRRFNEIRALSRDEVERRVNSAAYRDWTQNDLVAWEAAHTIYEVSQKYSDEPFFTDFRGATSFAASPGWGKYKFGASNAGRTGDQIKNSDAYAQAKANAQRAEEAKKK